MSAGLKYCPWCKSRATGGRLCPDCRNQATSLGRVSRKEFDRLPYGAIKLDKRGIITRVNRAERARSGLKPKDYLGRNFFDVAPCTNVRAFKGRFQRFLLSSQRTVEFNFTYRLPDAVIEVRITLVRLPDGALILASQK